MTLFSADVEADGPVPGLYSMLSLALVPVVTDARYDDTFYIEFAPVTDNWQPEAMAVNGLNRDGLAEGGADPFEGMWWMFKYLERISKGRPIFISDNPAFDFAFVNYYCWAYGRDPDTDLSPNPFGFSARRIGDIWSGLERNAYAPGNGWKHLRQTPHTHNALDDARGNAEALLAMNRDDGWRGDLR